MLEPAVRPFFSPPGPLLKPFSLSRSLLHPQTKSPHQSTVIGQLGGMSIPYLSTLPYLPTYYYSA